MAWFRNKGRPSKSLGPPTRDAPPPEPPADSLSVPPEPVIIRHDTPGQLEVVISTEGLDVVGSARRALRELAADPARSVESRADIERVLALDDERFLEEVNRRLEEAEPTEDELLEGRVLDARFGGAGNRVHAVAALLPEVRGTAHEADVVRDLFYERTESRSPEDQVDAIETYAAEPSADRDALVVQSPFIVMACLRADRRDLADRVIAAVPQLLSPEPPRGTFASELEVLPHSILKQGGDELAFRVAGWARDLPLGERERYRLHGVYGHVLERAGRTDEALSVLLADWDNGIRSEIHADRISLLAKRSGDVATARRVLQEAQTSVEFSSDDRRVTLERRLAKLTG